MRFASRPAPPMAIGSRSIFSPFASRTTTCRRRIRRSSTVWSSNGTTLKDSAGLHPTLADIAWQSLQIESSPYRSSKALRCARHGELRRDERRGRRAFLAAGLPLGRTLSRARGRRLVQPAFDRQAGPMRGGAARSARARSSPACGARVAVTRNRLDRCRLYRPDQHLEAVLVRRAEIVDESAAAVQRRREALRIEQDLWSAAVLDGLMRNFADPRQALTMMPPDSSRTIGRDNLRRLDVRSLLALRAHFLVVSHLLPFGERLESVRLDFREVCEQVFAACIRSDETKTLCVVEPLNRTSCHFQFDLKSKNTASPSRTPPLSWPRMDAKAISNSG